MTASSGVGLPYMFSRFSHACQMLNFSPSSLQIKSDEPHSMEEIKEEGKQGRRGSRWAGKLDRLSTLFKFHRALGAVRGMFVRFVSKSRAEAEQQESVPTTLAVAPS